MILVPLQPIPDLLFAIVDDEDSWVTALCQWSLTSNGYARGYIRGNTKYSSTLLHRLIMKPGPSVDVDHLNRDRLDCRRANMRIVSRSVNLQNSSKRCDNTSGYRGISWQKNTKKWFSYIWVNKKRINLGYFPEIQDAVAARDRAELQYFSHRTIEPPQQDQHANLQA